VEDRRTAIARWFASPIAQAEQQDFGVAADEAQRQSLVVRLLSTTRTTLDLSHTISIDLYPRHRVFVIGIALLLGSAHPSLATSRREGSSQAQLQRALSPSAFFPPLRILPSTRASVGSSPQSATTSTLNYRATSH